MDSFFRKAKCTTRVFIVWNSPAWMFTARYQRGLESVLNCHRDACVVVFSETIELNFFSGFVKDGFKVAVVMPNLDELLLGTPTHVFASFWYEWKQTRHYPFHYSELVRLAALYNPFVIECLKESYDYTQLRWNGADFLTRIASNFSVNGNLSGRKREIKFQPSFVFFPIGHNNITRYFSAPAMETEKAEQDMLFKTIVKEAVTFHFWNGLTSAMVPEAGSLAHRLINYNCETPLKQMDDLLKHFCFHAIRYTSRLLKIFWCCFIHEEYIIFVVQNMNLQLVGFLDLVLLVYCCRFPRGTN